MPYKFQPDNMNRMPTHFGPRTGPRRGPNGECFSNLETPKSTVVTCSFLTQTSQLEAFLPPLFSLAGDPVVTVQAIYSKEIEWLAGRGYNMLGVSFPATYMGERDQATGSFLTVLWENLADPIITGREELGFSKIYCELPEPTVFQGEWQIKASWLGFNFLDIKVGNLNRKSNQEISASSKPSQNDGILHYKYMPRTGEWGKADVMYATLTPYGNSNQKVTEHWIGNGTVDFHHARWENMPTQYNIVNAFHDLEILEYRGASVVKAVGGTDLSDQRILI